MKNQIANTLRLKLRDDKIRLEIKNRSKDHICRLKIKRTFTITLSIIVLFIGWFGIVYLQIYENDL